MTFLSTYTSTRFTRSAPARPRRWFGAHPVDVALGVVVFCAIVMSTGFGGGLMTASLKSVIGVPFGILLVFAVPLAAFLLPLRLSYAILCGRVSNALALCLSAVVAAGVFGMIDNALKSGPDGTMQARSITAGNTPLVHVNLPANGTIGLYREGAIDAAAQCDHLCQTVLQDDLARAVVVMTSPSTGGARYIRRPESGACPAGSTPSSANRSICSSPAPDDLPRLTFSLHPSQPPRRTIDLHGVWDIRIMTGAMTQTIAVAQAYIQRRGGLLTPNSAGALGERVTYTSQTRVTEFPAPETAHAQGDRPIGAADVPLNWAATVLGALQ